MQTQPRWRPRTPLPSPILRRGGCSPGPRGVEETWSIQTSEQKPLPSGFCSFPCREKHIHVLWNVHIIQPGIILFNSTITQKYRETLTLQAFIFCWLLQVLLCKSNTVKITLPSSTTLPSSSTCILNTCPQKTPTPSVLRDRPHFSEANACTLPSQRLGVSPQGWLLEVDPCSDAQPVPRREGDATLMPFSG